MLTRYEFILPVVRCAQRFGVAMACLAVSWSAMSCSGESSGESQTTDVVADQAPADTKTNDVVDPPDLPTGCSATCSLSSPPAGELTCLAEAPDTICAATCPSTLGFADCNLDPSDGCEATLDTVADCGACGEACASPPNGSPACSAGTCTVVSCNAGYDDCDGEFFNGCETSLGGDVENCAVCGNACDLANATPACALGTCTVESCQAGFDDCNANPSDGCEIDLRLDALNCGACGEACSLPHVVPSCSASTCVAETCEENWYDANGLDYDGCEFFLDWNSGQDVVMEDALPSATSFSTRGVFDVSGDPNSQRARLLAQLPYSALASLTLPAGTAVSATAIDGDAVSITYTPAVGDLGVLVDHRSLQFYSYLAGSSNFFPSTAITLCPSCTQPAKAESAIVNGLAGVSAFVAHPEYGITWSHIREKVGANPAMGCEDASSIMIDTFETCTFHSQVAPVVDIALLPTTTVPAGVLVLSWQSDKLGILEPNVASSRLYSLATLPVPASSAWSGAGTIVGIVALPGSREDPGFALVEKTGSRDLAVHVYRLSIAASGTSATYSLEGSVALPDAGDLVDTEVVDDRHFLLTTTVGGDNSLFVIASSSNYPTHHTALWQQAAYLPTVGNVEYDPVRRQILLAFGSTIMARDILLP